MSADRSNRDLLAEHLTNATAKHLVDVAASATTVADMTACFAESARQRLQEIEEAAAHGEADMA